MKFRNPFLDLESRYPQVFKNRFLRYGLPFVVFLVAGSFGIEFFASLRYEFRKNESLKPENLEKLGLRKKKFSLDEEYEKMKQMDIDSWENIRGPRPWEEPAQPNPSK